VEFHRLVLREMKLTHRLGACAGVAALWSLIYMSAPSVSAALAADVDPIASSKAAAQKGKATYLRLCQYCHGFDGKAHENIDFQATNLTELAGWKHGVEPLNIFNSIKSGAGDDMPAFKSKASDEEIWQLVAYVLSIGPDERRPKNE
jgi:mono/diheme cytochrome c family protein